MHGVMKAKWNNIGGTKTGKTMCENLEAQWSNVGGRSLNAKVYNAKYFGQTIHYDQNKKLDMFAVAHVGTLDGFSGKIVEHATMARKNNLLIYEKVLKLMIMFFIYKDSVFWISQIIWSLEIVLESYSLIILEIVFGAISKPVNWYPIMVQVFTNNSFRTNFK